MKQFLITLSLAVLFLMNPMEKAMGQEPIKIKVIKEKDGKREVIEKTYKSKEEMANDPDLGDIHVIHLDSVASNSFTFETDSANTVKIIVNKSSDEEGNIFITEDKVVEFSTDGGTFVFKGEEGDLHKSIIMFSDGDSLELEDEMHFESEDGNVFIMKGTGNRTSNSISWRDKGDKEHVHIQKIGGRVAFGQSIALEDASTSEIIAANFTEDKTLAPKSIEYMLNAQQGTLGLKFTSKSAPVKITIRDTSGQQVFNENVDPFNGSYNSKIDISGQAPGTYILEIRQGQKSLYKKLLIQ